MSNRGAAQKERRSPLRPRNGDARPCPTCAGRSEFSERYRLDGELVPAWVCDNAACREWALVRQSGKAGAGKSRKLISESREVGAQARRTVMRPRARTQRTGTSVDQSDGKLKGKKPR